MFAYQQIVARDTVARDIVSAFAHPDIVAQNIVSADFQNIAALDIVSVADQSKNFAAVEPKHLHLKAPQVVEPDQTFVRQEMVPPACSKSYLGS